MTIVGTMITAVAIPFQAYGISHSSLVVGLLSVVTMGIIWRAFCEFYVAIFRISDDLAALRRAAETDPAPRAPAPQPPRTF